MPDPDTQRAIEAALQNNWQQALNINLEILKASPEDVDAMNRLGKAYLELGLNKKAISISKEVLKINKYDPIATKNLLRASQTTSVKAKKTSTLTSSISFLEEPGKTKMITLVNLAPAKTILRMRCADCVNLTAKRHSLLVENTDGDYLGALPDDLGHRLLVLIKGGNIYEAFVKSVSKGIIVLFIKEKTRSKKFKNTPSFPSGNSDYLSFVREDHEQSEAQNPPGEETGDDEDESTFKKTESLHQDELPEEG